MGWEFLCHGAWSRPPHTTPCSLHARQLRAAAAAQIRYTPARPSCGVHMARTCALSTSEDRGAHAPRGMPVLPCSPRVGACVTCSGSPCSRAARLPRDSGTPAPRRSGRAATWLSLWASRPRRARPRQARCCCSRPRRARCRPRAARRPPSRSPAASWWRGRPVRPPGPAAACAPAQARRRVGVCAARLRPARTRTAVPAPPACGSACRVSARTRASGSSLLAEAAARRRCVWRPGAITERLVRDISSLPAWSGRQRCNKSLFTLTYACGAHDAGGRPAEAKRLCCVAQRRWQARGRAQRACSWGRAGGAQECSRARPSAWSAHARPWRSSGACATAPAPRPDTGRAPWRGEPLRGYSGCEMLAVAGSCSGFRNYIQQ